MCIPKKTTLFWNTIQKSRHFFGIGLFGRTFYKVVLLQQKRYLEMLQYGFFTLLHEPLGGGGCSADAEAGEGADILETDVGWTFNKIGVWVY